MPNLIVHTEQIRDIAIKMGFGAVGFTDPSEIDEQFRKQYDNWIKTGRHGEMHYMKNNGAQRFQPEMLFDGVKSAIVLLVPYNHGRRPQKSSYKMSRYAVGSDYHFVVKNKLSELLSAIQQINPEVKGRAFTDTAPVPERYLAASAGLGFIGKNGMLINPELGSFVFIGSLYTNATFKLDEPITGYDCGNCSLCMKACPTKAIVKPGELDSRRCISYKTIEFKGTFAPVEKLSGHIFGCDICQTVCPYNKNVPQAGWQEFSGKPEVLEMTDEDWKQLGSSKFKKRFGDTVLFRTGLRRLRRNISQNENKHNNS